MPYPHWSVALLADVVLPVVLCAVGYVVGTRYRRHAPAEGYGTEAGAPPTGVHRAGLTVPAGPMPSRDARDVVAEAAPLLLTTEEKVLLLRRVTVVFDNCVANLPAPCPERIVDTMCAVRGELWDWVTDGDPLADEYEEWVMSEGRWRR
jgi:hypothetical protein